MLRVPCPPTHRVKSYNHWDSGESGASSSRSSQSGSKKRGPRSRDDRLADLLEDSRRSRAVWEKMLDDEARPPAQDQLSVFMHKMEEMGKSSTAAVAVQLERAATAMERLSACMERYYGGQGDGWRLMGEEGPGRGDLLMEGSGGRVGDGQSSGMGERRRGGPEDRVEGGREMGSA